MNKFYQYPKKVLSERKLKERQRNIGTVLKLTNFEKALLKRKRFRFEADPPFILSIES